MAYQSMFKFGAVQKIRWNLNKDPFDPKERKSYNDSSTRELFYYHPEAASQKFNFAKLGKVHPLLMLCCLAPSLETTELVHKSHPLAIQEADSKYGWTPLFASLKWRDTPVDTIVYLIRNFPRAITAPAKDEWTPLHFACANGQPVEVVQLMLDMLGTQQEIQKALLMTNKLNWTPLHLAVAYNASFEVVQLLVNHCPQALTIRNNIGETPLEKARTDDKARIFSLLDSAADKLSQTSFHYPVPTAPVEPRHDRFVGTASQELSRNNVGLLA